MEVEVVDLYATNPGPIDGSVLYDQDKHVSTAVWEGQERGALRCHEHTSKLDQWTLTPKQIELVQKAGFGSVCESYLGKAPESGYTSGGMVKLSWLKEFFSHCPENASMEVIEQHTRAYLLYLVGSTIFSTTTGNKVPVMYLPLFGNFEQCGQYAWGAAALAFLYRALGNASLKTQSTISGCLTLLQCWSYFYLNIGRPKLNHDPMRDQFPFVLRWKGKQSGPTANRDVIFYRKALDSLKPSDVEWLPYRTMDSTVIPEDIKSTLILGRSKTMLICFDKAERHLPNRCLRQYGMLQSIPEHVDHWERKSRGVDGGVNLSGKMESELSEWMDRHLHIVDGYEEVDENEYLQWYLKITRRFVGRPISLSSEFQRTNAGLRDIAHIADTFITDGLDADQIESISRIRLIAHECLRDQFGGGPAMVPATPQVELGKRVRGKERVRRKGTGKRSRRDDNDVVQYNAASEDEQPQFYGAAMKIEELQLSHVDREADQAQIYALDNEVNSVLLLHADGDHGGENLQLCDANFELDQSALGSAADEENNEEPKHIAPEVNNEEPKHAAGEFNKEPNHLASEDNEEEASHLATEVHNEEPKHAADAVIKEELNQNAEEIDVANKAHDDAQPSDISKEVDDVSHGIKNTSSSDASLLEVNNSDRVT
ncbi:hypothetical protein K1719_014293 [Acacia pycnantha]|nr:hypothetical protein K1719_014293 [Acacia pycnantha]